MRYTLLLRCLCDLDNPRSLVEDEVGVEGYEKYLHHFTYHVPPQTLRADRKFPITSLWIREGYVRIGNICSMIPIASPVLWFTNPVIVLSHGSEVA